jgi:hypothetical protein
VGRGWLRRHAPAVLVAAAVVWIVTLIIWITIHPVAGPGNPME